VSNAANLLINCRPHSVKDNLGSRHTLISSTGSLSIIVLSSLQIQSFLLFNNIQDYRCTGINSGIYHLLAVAFYKMKETFTVDIFAHFKLNCFTNSTAFFSLQCSTGKFQSCRQQLGDHASLLKFYFMDQTNSISARLEC
jgi:hypothetical protein